MPETRPGLRVYVRSSADTGTFWASGHGLASVSMSQVVNIRAQCPLLLIWHYWFDTQDLGAFDMPLNLPLRMSNNKIQLFNHPVELYSCIGCDWPYWWEACRTLQEVQVFACQPGSHLLIKAMFWLTIITEGNVKTL